MGESVSDAMVFECSGGNIRQKLKTVLSGVKLDENISRFRIEIDSDDRIEVGEDTLEEVPPVSHESPESSSEDSSNEEEEEIDWGQGNSIDYDPKQDVDLSHNFMDTLNSISLDYNVIGGKILLSSNDHPPINDDKIPSMYTSTDAVRLLTVLFYRNEFLEKKEVEKYLPASWEVDIESIGTKMSSLASRGLVEPKNHPDDGRLKLYKITGKGKAAVVKTRKSNQEPSASISKRKQTAD